MIRGGPGQDLRRDRADLRADEHVVDALVRRAGGVRELTADTRGRAGIDEAGGQKSRDRDVLRMRIEVAGEDAARSLRPELRERVGLRLALDVEPLVCREVRGDEGERAARRV